MKRKYTFTAFFMLAILAACENPFVIEILPDRKANNNTANYIITINMINNISGDSITASPEKGKAGDEITLNYTLAGAKANNKLEFYGANTPIAAVNSAGTGTRQYIINEEDAADGVITINAVFTHTDNLIITKEPGSAVSVLIVDYLTESSITVKAVTVVTPAYGQTAEYAIASMLTPEPVSGWQDGLTFSGLSLGTGYYIFARSKENDNYNAGTAQVSALIKIFKITINITGKEFGDLFPDDPRFGNIGDTITLDYTLANIKANSRLTFSGTTVGITTVNSVGTGTMQYVISEADAAEGVITINATFTHSDKTLDTIAFADTANVIKIYGDLPFTKAITNTGTGTGAISYAPSDSSVATVNASGAVTIHKAGTATITATKAADALYEQAIASYTLTVTKATGRTVTVPASSSITTTGITVGAVTVATPNYGQTAEYAIAKSATPVPVSGYQDGVTFTGLDSGTDYYVFARSKENDNCSAGAARTSAVIRTLPSTSGGHDHITINNIPPENVGFVNPEEPNITPSGTVTITVSGSYDSYQWSVDGVTHSNTTNSLTLNGADYADGKHEILVIVIKNGVPHSEMIYFYVNN